MKGHFSDLFAVVSCVKRRHFYFVLVPCLINSVRDFGNLSFFNGQGI